MRKATLALTVLIAVALIVGAAGCGEGEEVSPTPMTTPTPTPTPAPTLTATPEPIPTPLRFLSSDGRIEISVDRIERSSRFEGNDEDEHYWEVWGTRPLLPDEGVDLVVVHLTIVPKQDICFGSSIDRSTLIDLEGNEARTPYMQFGGVLPILETKTTCEDLFEGITAQITFAFPQYATPANFKFVYPFMEPGKNQSREWGRVDVGL